MGGRSGGGGVVSTLGQVMARPRRYGEGRGYAARVSSAGQGGEPQTPDALGADGGDGDRQFPDVLGDHEVGGRVVRGGAQRAIGFVAANLLTLAGAVILTRYLGVDDFGRFGTVMALLAIVQGIADAGLTMTGSRELALTDDRVAVASCWPTCSGCASS